MRPQIFNRWAGVMGLGLAVAATALADPSPRARDLGIPFDGTPGPLNAITDVAGVRVGHVTLISGDGPLVVGKGPVRTGVTAVLPRGEESVGKPVFAGWYAQNGNGEMTGTTWVEESGLLEGPVMLTNTHSVGVVRDAVIRWRVAKGDADATGAWWSLPVVAETWDGWLNDINGFHVTTEDALKALDSARPGPVTEGSVGGGTGMICNGFKGGIGTSSRRINVLGAAYTLGALVQCNYGRRPNLRIAGIPVGRVIGGTDPYAWMPSDRVETGSIIVVIATDAPLLPHQLKRVARRVTLGLGRTGSISGNGSGDIFIAFSTANDEADVVDRAVALRMLPNDALDDVFEATVEATEEAIVNAMIAARDMTGIDGHRVEALPQARVRQILAEHRVLVGAPPPAVRTPTPSP